MPALSGSGGTSGLLGIHTVNRAGNLSVIDGFSRRSRIGSAEIRLRHRD
jgi:hypothetical protein